MPKPFDHGAADDWEPEDDPDYWTPDGERAGAETEKNLRWRVIANDGFRFERDGGGQPIESRRDGLSVMYHVGPTSVWKKLEQLHHNTAGWAKISADGWTIEPMKPDA